MIKLSRITEESGIVEHRRKYLERGGKLIDIGYLKQCDCYGLFKDDQQIAGFSLKRQGPYRVKVPDLVDSLQNQDLHEISALWLDPSCRSNWLRLSLIAAVCFTVIAGGARGVVGFTSTEQIWKSTYQNLGAQLIAQGPTEIDSAIRDVAVFELRVMSMITHAPYYLVSKLLKKHSRYFQPVLAMAKGNRK